MARTKSVPMPKDEYHSVSVRKIDNGFIVSKSSSTPKGYKSTEVFSPTKPKLDIPVAAKPAPKPSGMSAVKRAGGNPKGR